MSTRLCCLPGIILEAVLTCSLAIVRDDFSLGLICRPVDDIVGAGNLYSFLLLATSLDATANKEQNKTRMKYILGRSMRESGA